MSISRAAVRRGWGWCLSICWLLMLVLAALFASHLAPSIAPDLLHNNAAPLTPGHLLGTDSQGQDVASGLLYGARTALVVSLPTALLAATLGTGLGVVAGYWGDTRLKIPLAWLLPLGTAGALYALITAPVGSPLATWWPWCLVGGSVLLGRVLSRRGWRASVALPADSAVSAAVVFLAAVPRLLLVVILAAAIPPNAMTLIVLLTLTFWPPTARLMRAEVQRVRQLPYFEAGLALGLPTRHLLFYHVLPNTWQVVRTTLPLSIAILIGLETTLSFLGIGLPPELPSWGRLLAAARVSPSSWWLILFPTMALLLTALSLRRLLGTPDTRRM